MTHKSPRHAYDDYKIFGLEMRKLKDRIAELEAIVAQMKVDEAFRDECERGG